MARRTGTSTRLAALASLLWASGCFALADKALDDEEPRIDDDGLAVGGGGNPPDGSVTTGTGSHDAGAGSQAPNTSNGSGGGGSPSSSTGSGGSAPVCQEPGPAPGGPCPEICNGGCEGSTCLIDCGAEDCEDESLVCPPGFDCDVACIGEKACAEGWLSCPFDHACSLWCQGQQACKGLHVAGGASLTMYCADNDACQATNVVCGGGPCEATCAGGAKTPTVNCGASCACSPC